MTRRRRRIHPAIACTAIGAITVLAIAAQFFGHGEEWKYLAIAFISYLAGVKMRRILPVT